MTDNGSAYVSRRFRSTLSRRAIRHIRTRPYRPETNGKAERFIQILLLGWHTNGPTRTRSIGLGHFGLGCAITTSADLIAPSE